MPRLLRSRYHLESFKISNDPDFSEKLAAIAGLYMNPPEHAKVPRWLKRHPRFHVHLTPTSGSWLNMVERFFRDLSENRLRRGVFRSVPEPINARDEYVDLHNENLKPFIRIAKANDILAKVMRAQATLDNSHSVRSTHYFFGASTGLALSVTCSGTRAPGPW